MKTIRINKVVVTLLCSAVAVAGLGSCTDDTVDRQGGKLPDKEAVENTYGILNSTRASEREVDMLLTEGRAGAVTDMLYYQITQSAPTGLSLEIRADLSQETLDAFNEAREAEYIAEGITDPYVPYILLPEANFELPDGKTLEIAPHKTRSASKRIQIQNANLTAGRYLLPVAIAQSERSDPAQTLFYTLIVRQPQLGEHELHQGEDFFFVFYINTNQYQPLLVDDYFMEKKPRLGQPKPGDGSWYKTIGNIINLRTVTLNYDASIQRAVLNLGKDMTHVLNHVVKYIRPLQDKGRKVCISIEGGGTGLGFCNLSDGQIADFAAQIKAVVETYELDGVNLWDRFSGYGKEGMPAVNTTSYPKLIKALREALGVEKLLTVTVYEEPTKMFYNVEASGGIAVGDYIDYAWSGYNSEAEAPQLLDPWHPDWQHSDQTTYPYGRVSAYTQKPIANLDPSKFGCINFPLYGGAADAMMTDQSFVAQWVTAGYKPNKMIVFSDLRTILQDSYETIWNLQITSSTGSLADDGPFSALGSRDKKRYGFDKSVLDQLPDGRLGYGKWLKDW